MYRFALRPLWILSHLLVIAIIAGCVTAAFWQLDRLDQKREVIDRFEQRSRMEVVAATDLLSADSSPAEVDAVALRGVEATGTYLVDEQVTVRHRTYNATPGHWVLTPLLTRDGTAVVVNRGWVPLSVGDDPDALRDVTPPDGEVTVVGTLSASQERGRIGPSDPEEGSLDVLSRADVGRIAQQLDEPVLPAYVTLAGQEPPSGELPIPVEPVEPDEGPHLGYAVQWFIFAAIAAGGYPLVLRKVARDKAAERRGEPRRRRSPQVPVDD